MLRIFRHKGTLRRTPIAIGAALTVLCLLGPGVVARGAATRVVLLYHMIVISVPPKANLRTVSKPPGGFLVYSITSSDGSRLLLQLDEFENGFFSYSEKARSKKVMLNGMTSWVLIQRKQVQINIMLPKRRGCSVQYYALLTYATDDRVAARLAHSLKATRPFPCIDVVP